MLFRSTAGLQLQVGAGKVTLAAGTFSTNTATSPRALDLGLTAANAGSSDSTEFYVNSGVTMSNTVYVAGGTGTRTMGTESGGGTATFNGEIYLDNALSVSAGSEATALFNGNIINSGALTKIGAGTVALAGNNSFSGDVTVSAGTLSLSGGSAVNNTNAVTVSSGATLNLAGNETVGSIAGAGNISLNANQLIAGQNNSSTSYSGVMSGTGAFVKTGTGTLTFGSANTYSGQTYIVGGTLLYNTAPGTGGTGIINIGEENSTGTASTFAMGGSGLTFANNINVRAGDGDAASLEARNTTGTTTLSGNITLNKNAALAATNGGALSLTGTTLSFANLTTLAVTNSANISIANQMTTSGDALLEKRGSGTLTLTGTANSGDLRFDLYGGKLQASAAGNLGSAGSYKANKLYFDGGTLQAT